MPRPDNYAPVNWHHIFQVIDTDDDGLITLSELRKYLLDTPISDVPLDSDLVDSLLYHVDYNHDGFINLQEFYGLVNVPLDHQTRSIIRRTLRATALSMTPRSQLSHKDRLYYTDEYSCYPPPFAILLLSAAQIGVYLYYGLGLGYHMGPYSPVVFDSPLIYNPECRREAWRFISYMLLHAGYIHLASNVIVGMVIGIPLEMVHKWWRILLLYLAGVIAGSLAASIFDPHAYLVGASGGVYSLIAAHLANVVINWKEMPFNWGRLLCLLILICTDVGVFVYHAVFQVDSKISYVAHVAGFLTGLLLGLITLRNLKVHFWEVIVKWMGLVIFIGFIIAAIVIQVAFPDLVGLKESTNCAVVRFQTLEA